jgi:hypothetical protein
MLVPARAARRRGRMGKTVLDLDFDPRDFSELFRVTDKIPVKK